MDGRLALMVGRLREEGAIRVELPSNAIPPIQRSFRSLPYVQLT